MRCRTRLAYSVATTLALAFTAQSVGAARLGDDPFPLDANLPPPNAAPKGPAAARPLEVGSAPDYVLYASATINGRALPRMVRLLDRGGQLFIARDSAEYAGLKLPAGTGEVALDSLSGVTATFDRQTYELTLSVAYLPNSDNVIDYRPAAHAANPRLSAMTALSLDYDVVAQAGPEGTRIAGYISPRLSRGNLALSSDWTFGAPGRTRAVRLDTALTVDMPHSLMSLTAGDFVQSVGPEGRAVRMGGFQLGSNFGLRPDFITYPLPDFSGNLAVPQQLDLIVNDKRLDSRSLQAGSFSLRGVPVGAGRGQLGVVVRDTLGRDQYVSLNYYVSRDLLSPGLNQWSVSIGAVRRNYGVRSNDYGPVATSFVFRRGITPRLTLGLNGGFSQIFGNLGLDATTTLGNLAQLSVSASTSSMSDAINRRSGSAVSFNLVSAGRPVSARLSGRVATCGYDDLASSQGQAPPPSFVALGFDFDLGKLGGLSFSAVRERDTRPEPGQPSRSVRSVMSLNYGNQLGRVSLFASASWRRAGGRSSVGLFAGLSVPLGHRTRASASWDRSTGAGGQGIVSLDEPAVVESDFGYGLRAEQGRINRGYAQGSYIGKWGRVTAEGELIDGRVAGRISARGALVVTGGNLFAVRQSDQGMVLIETNGVNGVQMLRENQPAGKSANGGSVLIPGLPPSIPTRIGIAPGSLPIGGVSASLGEVVAVPAGRVAKLDLGIRPFIPVLVQLLDQRGVPFAAGMSVRLMPSNSEAVVGIDGMIELNAASPDRFVEVDRGNGAVCHADLAELAAPDPRTAAPAILRCFGEVRSLPIATKPKPRSGTPVNSNANTIPAVRR